MDKSAIETELIKGVGESTEPAAIEGRLTELLSRQPEFQPGDAPIVFLSGGGYGLNPQSVARHLIKIARDRSPNKAVAWLERLFSNTPAKIRIISLLRALQPPPGGVKINGISIAQISELPNTPRSAQVMSDFTGIRGLPPSAFAAALIALPPLMRQTQMGLHSEAYFEQTSKIAATILAFTAAGAGAPIVVRTWSEFLDDNLEQIQLGVMFSAGLLEEGFSVASTIVDSKSLTFVRRYLRTSGELRRKLDIASARLSLAKRRTLPADKAIETSIALESLLGDDRFDLTYKLRLRAAMLIDKNLDERLITSKAVERLYRLRGDVVHGSSRSLSITEAHQIDGGLEICARVIRRLVSIGKLPRWAHLELSGGKSV
jgi:hypothetical protein